MGILTAILDLLFPPKCIFCQKLLRAGTKVCCEDVQGAVPERRRQKWDVFSYLLCAAHL